MKKLAFINSHTHSGAEYLYNVLSENPYIQGYSSSRQNTYYSSYDFFQILNQKHKRNDKHAIYLDQIYYNYALSTKINFSNCYFIHLIRSPKCLNLVLLKTKKDPIFVVRRYMYRLRRICEIAKRTPKSIFLNFEDLQKKESMELIKDFLSLSNEPEIPIIKEPDLKKDLISYDLMKEADECYEKHLAFLNQFKINLV